MSKIIVLQLIQKQERKYKNEIINRNSTIRPILFQIETCFLFLHKIERL